MIERLFVVLHLHPRLPPSKEFTTQRVFPLTRAYALSIVLLGANADIARDSHAWMTEVCDGNALHERPQQHHELTEQSSCTEGRQYW